MKNTVPEAIEDIRARHVGLAVEADEIVVDGRVLPEEKKFIREHRSEVISYLQNSQSPAPVLDSETPEMAYQCGYRDGIEHAVAGTTGDSANCR